MWSSGDKLRATVDSDGHSSNGLLVRPSGSSGSLSSATTTPCSDSASTASLSPTGTPTLNALRRTLLGQPTAHSPADGRRMHRPPTIGSDSDDDDCTDDCADYSLGSMRDFYADVELADVADDGCPGAVGFASDELPVFRCQSMSPTSRSISPIDHHDSSGGDEALYNFSMSPCGSADEQLDAEMRDPDSSYELISLEEIHARLSGGGRTDEAGDGDGPACNTPLDKRLKLETIVEGVFLETPPRGRSQRGAWQVATQHIDTFVADQQRRCFDCGQLDGLPGDADADEAMLMLLSSAGENAAEPGRDGDRNDATDGEDINIDRMLNSFHTQLNMC